MRIWYHKNKKIRGVNVFENIKSCAKVLVALWHNLDNPSPILKDYIMIYYQNWCYWSIPVQVRLRDVEGYGRIRSLYRKSEPCECETLTWFFWFLGKRANLWIPVLRGKNKSYLQSYKIKRSNAIDTANQHRGLFTGSLLYFSLNLIASNRIFLKVVLDSKITLALQVISTNLSKFHFQILHVLILWLKEGILYAFKKIQSVSYTHLPLEAYNQNPEPASCLRYFCLKRQTQMLVRIFRHNPAPWRAGDKPLLKQNRLVHIPVSYTHLTWPLPFYLDWYQELSWSSSALFSLQACSPYLQ